MMSARLTEHFNFSEFARTSRQEFAQANNDAAAGHIGNLLSLCAQLEKVRAMFHRPIFITSGFRCPELNAAVGGAPNSQHLFGLAADFVVEGFQDPTSMRFIFDWCKNNLDYRQLIFENPEGRKPWIHLGLPNGDGKREALFWNGSEYEPA